MSVVTVIAWVLGVYFAVYLLGTLAMTVVSALVTRRQRHQILPSTVRRLMRAQLAPRISLCIPAYNESAIVADTVRSSLALDYPDLEVLVVNDGSTDATLEVLQREFDLQPCERQSFGHLPHGRVRGVYVPRAPIPLLVIDKENGGRSDALNAAIDYAQASLVTVLDGDELLSNETLARAIRPFLVYPEETVAAGAALGVANGARSARGRIVERARPRRVLPLFQAVEYERSFRISRVASSSLRALPIISGGFGIFRRDVLLAIGGYASDTLGEDFDITLRIHRHFDERNLPHRIAQIPNVLCWTTVPDTRRVLKRQRMRWHRGLRQVLSKHRGMLLRPRYGTVGAMALPWAWLYELVNPFVVVLATGVTIVYIAFGSMTWHALLLLGFITWASIVVPTLAALLMTDFPAESGRGWRNLGAIATASFLEIPYQLLTLTFRLESVVRRRIGWGEMERSLKPEGPQARVGAP